MHSMPPLTLNDLEATARQGAGKLTLQAVLRYFRHRRLPRVDGGTCIIMGNGPSLADTLNDHSDILQSQRVVAVNTFALSEHYAAVRPEFYCLVDPAYSSAIGCDWARDNQIAVLNALRQKTTWDMHAFFPLCPAQLLLDDIFDGSSVELHILNLFPSCSCKWVRNHVYRSDWLLPPVQNVLIAAIYASINMGFTEIYLTGADHSWLHDVILNDEGLVCMRERHFDGATGAKPVYNKILPPRHPVRMDEWTGMMQKVFRSHHMLAEYATFRGAHVYNATPGSLIDAFPRRELTAILGQNSRAESMGARSGEAGVYES